jgi:hypothetical protein
MFLVPVYAIGVRWRCANSDMQHARGSVTHAAHAADEMKRERKQEQEHRRSLEKETEQLQRMVKQSQEAILEYQRDMEALNRTVRQAAEAEKKHMEEMASLHTQLREAESRSARQLRETDRLTRALRQTERERQLDQLELKKRGADKVDRVVDELRRRLALAVKENDMLQVRMHVNVCVGVCAHVCACAYV